jgi:hypothetical protein
VQGQLATSGLRGIGRLLGTSKKGMRGFKSFQNPRHSVLISPLTGVTVLAPSPALSHPSDLPRYKSTSSDAHSLGSEHHCSPEWVHLLLEDVFYVQRAPGTMQLAQDFLNLSSALFLVGLGFELEA